MIVIADASNLLSDRGETCSYDGSGSVSAKEIRAI
jgi:hypothetical protein